MARTVNINAPYERTDAVLAAIAPIDGVLSLELYRGVSLNPPGDVIKVTLPNSYLNQLMRALDPHGLGQPGGISVATNESSGVVPTGSAATVCRDNNEATWEEMELTISDDSNTTPSTLCIMFIAGGLMAAGIITNAIHIAIGAMLIAPGFMPITRIALGWVARQSVWRYGLIDLLRGYAALMVGAWAATWLFGALDYPPLPAGSNSYYLTEQKLAHYWTSITAVSVFTSLLSGIGGGLLVASRRSVLASGVMVGLALVPSAALIAMGLAQAEFGLALKAAYRFAIEVGLVLSMSAAVFVCLRLRIHKRDMRL